MGASDIVPGVSGGTMALILGIYEELINSIKSVDLTVIRLALAFKIKEVFNIIPWQFLLAVFVGIMGAIFTLAQGLEWLLENQPVYLWSFFFGLVLASGVTVRKQVSRWTPPIIISAIIAVVVSYVIVGLVPGQTPDALWFVFLSGMIAICAMILPGISGSFILVLLGKYQYVLEAVNELDILTVGVFGAGAVIGLVSFARLVSWLFNRFPDLTIAILMGLMLGSLRKLWPWKITLQTALDRHGKEVPIEELNVLPPEFGGPFFLAVGLAIVGFTFVMTLDYLAGDNKTL
ncbi:MAG: DUF368 domain-containing protein [Chloroflexota bacterium]